MVFALGDARTANSPSSTVREYRHFSSVSDEQSFIASKVEQDLCTVMALCSVAISLRQKQLFPIQVALLHLQMEKTVTGKQNIRMNQKIVAPFLESF